MKRWLLFTGSLLGILGHLVPAFVYMFTFVVLSPLLSTSGAGVVALIGVIGLVCIVGVILNAVAMASFTKNSDEFKKRYGVIITAIVFDFVLLVYSILSIIVANTNNASWVYIFALIFLSFAIIFKIVDLAQEKKRKTEQKEVNENITIEQKIEKLNEMKNQGLIDDEEYAKLKNSYINEVVEKNN
ncbi:MAG: hypothetical protein IJA69_02955 [Clostridia bacterium]|nr:hypothetical protein [Clostridia bacterium]